MKKDSATKEKNLVAIQRVLQKLNALMTTLEKIEASESEDGEE